MPEMANSSLSQLLSSAPARSTSARERSAAGTSAHNDSFSRTLDQKMQAPERPAERPVERPAEPRNTAQTPAKAEAPAEARQNSASGKAAEGKADANAEATASAASATPDTTDSAATAPVSAKLADDETLAADTDATLIAANGEPANASPAAALAATPAALAAVTASPAVAADALPSADGDTAEPQLQARAARGDMTSLASNSGQAKTLTSTDDPRPELAAAQAEDAEIAAPASQARPNRFADLLAANTAPRGDRVGMLTADSPSMPGSMGSTALNTAMSGVQVPAADRPQATQAALPMHVNTPASDATWGDAVGNRVLWLVGQNNSKAELILTPPHLGKLEISITVTGDTTTAQFTAATPAAREALEQAMPRLREMLEQAGVTLTDSNVNTTARDSNGEPGQRQGHAGNARGAEIAPDNLMSRSGPWLQRGEGMIDTFA